MTPTCVLGEDKVTTTEFVRKIVFVVYVQRSETGKINLSERVCKLWPLHTQRSIITVVGLIKGVVSCDTHNTGYICFSNREALSSSQESMF